MMLRFAEMRLSSRASGSSEFENTATVTEHRCRVGVDITVLMGFTGCSRKTCHSKEIMVDRGCLAGGDGLCTVCAVHAPRKFEATVERMLRMYAEEFCVQ